MRPRSRRSAPPGSSSSSCPTPRARRIPLTIADWDPDRGSVTSVFMVVGTSTQKLSRLNAGDEVPVYVGPLGTPVRDRDVRDRPLRRRLFRHRRHPSPRPRPEGGRQPRPDVVGRQGRVPVVLGGQDQGDERQALGLLARPSLPRRRTTSRAPSKPSSRRRRSTGSSRSAAPISCRPAPRPPGPSASRRWSASIPSWSTGRGCAGPAGSRSGASTKFACVDGPDFDGHAVDWQELYARRRSYFDEEIRSLCDWEEKTFP